MREERKKIIYNKQVTAHYHRLGVSWSTPLVSPGQFVMVRVSDGFDPLLRRPFGVYNVLGSKGKFTGTGIELLYRVVGKGTRILSTRKPGDDIDILGPLGDGFPYPEGYKKVIMAAGGMGIAPLYLLAKGLPDATLLFGARNKEETVFVKDFKKILRRVKVATEDGSSGRKGLVTELVREELSPGAVLYACGPIGMLKAVSAIAHSAGVKCFVSLERAMACGIGVCLGCAVRSRPHGGEENKDYKMVCSDGPVFDSADIDWDSFKI